MTSKFIAPIYSLITFDRYILISYGLGGSQYGCANALGLYEIKKPEISISTFITNEDFVENL